MLRNDLVTQGILTKDEAQYVTGTMSEGKFTKPITITNEIFHITKDGKTADAKGISLAVKDNESGQALATHLSNKTINLDGSFWEGKTPRKYLADFQDALVQDGLIKPYQKQYIVLYDDPFPPLKQGQEYKNFRFLVHKNGDYEEVNGTTLKVSIANEAQYIVDKLNNKTINLDLNQ